MTTLSIITTAADLTTNADLHLAGQVANAFAAQNAFTDYRSRKAHNTVSRQTGDLATFAGYLAEAGVTVGDLAHDPAAWRGVTWGLVEGFIRWQLKQGFAIGSINVKLSTIKTYAKLAVKAGTLGTTEYALICTVEGYRHSEARHIDEARETTRRSTKKAEATTITPEQAKKLKAPSSDTPQGRRDAVMMSLMINLGLRVGEVVGLKVRDVDIKNGYITFWREKVGKTQTHQLSNGLWTAMKEYFEAGDVPTDPDAPLLRASSQHGTLTHDGLTRFGIMQRVKHLGKRIGVETLSPHDLRHYWATNASRNGTLIDRLQDAGGWASPAMPLRYTKAAAIANDGVKLTE